MSTSFPDSSPTLPTGRRGPWEPGCVKALVVPRAAAPSGRKNVLRKLLRILYRRLKAGFSVC